MILQPFINASDYESTVDYFKAITDNAGLWSKGDLLKRVAVANESQTSNVALFKWYNVTTGSTELTTLPTAGTDCIVWDGARVFVGSEILVADATAKPFANIPPEANHAEIHVWNGDIVFNVDSTVPAPGTFDGYRQANGVTFELESKDEITNFQVIELTVGSPASLKITYFCVGNDPNA